MRKHPQIVIGVLLIALFVCIAITAPLLAPNDPNATNLALNPLVVRYIYGISAFSNSNVISVSY